MHQNKGVKEVSNKRIRERKKIKEKKKAFIDCIFGWNVTGRMTLIVLFLTLSWVSSSLWKIIYINFSQVLNVRWLQIQFLSNPQSRLFPYIS